MAVDRQGSTNQYHRLALESKWIKRLQTTTPLGINIKGANPLWFHCLVSIYMWSYWSPHPFHFLFSQNTDHIIIAALPAHVLEAGANAWRRWCRFPLGKGHDVPHVWSGNSGPLFFRPLAIFNFPFSTSSALYTFLVVFFYIPHFDQFGHLYLFLPIHICLSHLASYTFCHTQFFTPFSTSVPFSSNFFYPTCFLFQFFPVHLTVRFCHCLLSLLICPLWRKAWLFDTLGCNFFPLFFPCFPHWMMSHFPLLFTYFYWLLTITCWQ